MTCLLPFSLWVVRNWLRSSGAVNRTIAFHPISAEQVRALLGVVTRWFMPLPGVPPAGRLVLLAGIVAIVLQLMAGARRSNCALHPPAIHRNLMLVRVAIVSAAGYMGFLFFSISFMDVSTPLDSRILSPAYPYFVLTLIAALSMAQSLHGTRGWRTLVLGSFCALLVALQAYRSGDAIHRYREHGFGWESWAWRTRPIVEYVRALPQTAMLYSDAGAMFYFLADRATHQIPAKYSDTSLVPNPRFRDEMVQMRSDLLSGPGLLIIALDYPSNPGRDELVSEWDYEPVLDTPEGIVLRPRRAAPPNDVELQPPSAPATHGR